ncbi:MAG: M6 family metalloprotease domain-containing protein [Isosphaeraceae bacterium]
MKRTYARFYLSAALITAVLPGVAVAIPANPNLIIAEQPDGTQVVLRVHGDERFNWQADLNDYPVQRKADGLYVYAAPVKAAAAGAAVEAQEDLVVGKSDPAAAGVKKGAPPRPGIKGLHSPERLAAPAGAEPANRIAPAGAVKNVVILMRFSNHAGRTLPTTSDVDKLFNAVGGHPTLAPSGSVRDVYLANSYGAFQLNSTVFAWVTLPKTEKYYADGTSGGGAKMHEAIKDALVLADPLVNFKNFDKDSDGFVDAIAFLHSGYGAEWGGTDSDGTDYKDRIWSHRWSIPTWTSAEGVKVSAYHISPSLWGTSGTDPGRIGVICHETGHFFGLPDLYDGGTGSGIGSWCMMANSWGFDGSQYYPPHFSAWSKIQLGWVVPTPITTPGTYTAPASATSATVFKITTGYPSGEYLLIENRQAVGYDQKIPSGTGGDKGGLAVWHIDDVKGTNTDPGYPGQSGYPGNNKHYMVAILQADGKYDLEKGVNRGDGDDVYRKGFKSEISHATVPNTDAYQGGTVVTTDNTISEISASGPTMTFKYSTGAPPSTTSGRLGFAWADQPAAASYTPSVTYAYNSAGGAITVTRTGTGVYSMKFAGLGGGGKAGGHVQVTAYGSAGETANVANWLSVGADFVVNVRCFNSAGKPVDARYNVMVIWP